MQKPSCQKAKKKKQAKSSSVIVGVRYRCCVLFIENGEFNESCLFPIYPMM